jgi:hypothetical protein
MTAFLFQQIGHDGVPLRSTPQSAALQRFFDSIGAHSI